MRTIFIQTKRMAHILSWTVAEKPSATTSWTDDLMCSCLQSNHVERIYARWNSVRVFLLLYTQINDENLSNASWKLEWTRRGFKNETKSREIVDREESYQTLIITMGIILNSLFLIKDRNIVSWMKRKQCSWDSLWGRERTKRLINEVDVW